MARSAVRTKGRRVTSALTLAETARAILRARVAAVLARVRRPLPVEPIRPLDAVHLATAELLGEPPPLMTIVTRDDGVRENAEELDYAVP
jgi:predicted nucleic acid-binding protein